ncbi:proline permease PrnB [Hypoxylon trugodes]|uniref:proline permease PrnB n=1 Tax=Hypoxylon trugodes TaxID=326681 RepID=UPI00219B75F5|nr:proline permease PrnB [Hypoxylon trugodes]KAI1392419.1 proline permease PrnB [Hypoxylon trugodes]
MSVTQPPDGKMAEKSVVQDVAQNGDGESIEVEVSEATRGTKRGLKSRHAQLIALGGTIGTALFVGSGRTLAKGGPGFLLLTYILMSGLVLLIVAAITQTASYLPVKGATPSYFASRYVSNSLGWSMGWFYWYSFGIFVPYELTASSLVIEFWNPPINPAVWITIMLVVVVGLNLLPVSVYGETEFWFASLKVITIIGLLMLSFILFWWGGPGNPRLGFHYWNDPGAVNHYILEGPSGLAVSFWSTLISALLPFSFAPEMLVFCSGEMKSPRRNLPRAAKSFVMRILIFYVGSVIAIGVICPSNDPGLSSGGQGAGSSPFVLGIKRAGIQGLDSVVNAVILTSAWSAANAFIYQSSRSLYSMSINGDAPKIFSRCTKKGVPYVAVIGSSLFSLLAYLNVNSKSGVVFDWLVNLVNTAAFISWVSCAITNVRFQKAFAAQGLDEKELPFKALFQPWASYFCIIAFTALCLINGFDVFLPGSWSVSSFLSAYIGIPIFFCLYLGHRFTVGRSDPWFIPLKEVDLSTGLDELKADEKPEDVSPSLRTRLWGMVKKS